MAETFIKVHGPMTEAKIKEALQKHGVHGMDDLVRQAMEHVKKEHATPVPDFWIVYNNGKWGLCGPN